MERRMSTGPRAPRAGLIKASLFLLSAVLVVALFLFTNRTIAKLTSEVKATSSVLARFFAQASIPATQNPEVQGLFSNLIGSIDFPLVITDDHDVPRAWRSVGIDPELVPAASIDSVAEGRDITPVIRARLARVERRVVELDRRNQPIQMQEFATRTPLGALHYGAPAVLDQLRWMPYVSVAAVALLISLGLLGLAGIRQAEQRTIWVGMAKETAHQLGTPISSLLGWVELMRAQAEGTDPEVKIDRAELDETLSEMARDLDRLSKVAQRFSQVGSTPRLQRHDPTPVVREAVQYMRRRLPKAAGEIEVEEEYDPVPPVDLSPELMEWAIENLLSNAVTALDRHPGRIRVAVEHRPKAGVVEVVVQDNGRGMAPADQNHAFEAGFTTKRRGWGLGLALARRVVEEYHGGKLYIRESAPGEGTTMVISLNV
jgi:NtrC-family two-component system sensor histidine kinase KinB